LQRQQQQQNKRPSRQPYERDVHIASNMNTTAAGAHSGALHLDGNAHSRALKLHQMYRGKLGMSISGKKAVSRNSHTSQP
jgi:hypothetical protein